MLKDTDNRTPSCIGYGTWGKTMEEFLFLHSTFHPFCVSDFGIAHISGLDLTTFPWVLIDYSYGMFHIPLFIYGKYIHHVDLQREAL